MAGKRLVSTLVITGVLVASVSTSALAGDRHNNDAAIAVGVIGGIVLGSLIANAQSAPAPQVYYPSQPEPQPYYAPPQTYYPAAPVQQVYYGAPQPVYVPQASVTISGSNYGGYDRGYGRDYDRARHEYRPDWQYGHREHYRH